MRKTLLIALAGMMMFAFTQCGNGNKEAKNSDENNTEAVANDDSNAKAVANGSKEFQASKKMYDNIEKGLDQAKTCDELQSAMLVAVFSAMADTTVYTDSDKMTPEEEKQLEAIAKRVDEKMSKKTKELGCEGNGLEL